MALVVSTLVVTTLAVAVAIAPGGSTVVVPGVVRDVVALVVIITLVVAASGPAVVPDVAPAVIVTLTVITALAAIPLALAVIVVPGVLVAADHDVHRDLDRERLTADRHSRQGRPDPVLPRRTALAQRPHIRLRGADLHLAVARPIPRAPELPAHRGALLPAVHEDETAQVDGAVLPPRDRQLQPRGRF